jgi:AmmeMemoRadiSam system protein A
MIAIPSDVRSQLLVLARAAIRAAVTGAMPGEGDRIALPSGIAHSGVFVTLRVDGELRGCIGTLDPSQSIADAVIYAATAAATRDRRFEPLRGDELDRLRFEITVLEAREPISGPGDITVGQHGLHLELGGARGILLPQVAPEQGWDAAAFLEGVCRKAGLPRGAWRDPAARLSRFGAVKMDASL